MTCAAQIHCTLTLGALPSLLAQLSLHQEKNN